MVGRKSALTVVVNCRADKERGGKEKMKYIEMCLDRMERDYSGTQFEHVKNYIKKAKEELKAAQAKDSTATAHNNVSTPLCPDCGKSDRVESELKFYCMRCARPL